ncbi:hypothetical protein GIB67_015641 [Kingdonia uniflora]|uniref:Dof zinc finger protein n=1 Tax=Kingdonia uniflora TaxID=39325 RepID=A0A7J7NU61_9MAGN|nr:hypothetical protein GIB67_015641 [Kingdonia uniflora]
MNQPPPQGPQQPQICPRCESNNTKFCYFNNCSLSQPRYRCKTCKRHWTLGGTLRNVPVGGGSRKTKQTSTRNSPSSSSPGLIDMPSSHIPPTSYSSGWFSSSLQPFNQVGNIVNESGVSSFVTVSEIWHECLRLVVRGIEREGMWRAKRLDR